MWEAYTTWISGIFLLGIVYYFSGGVYLVDRQVSNISFWAAAGLSLTLLLLAWLIYDALWRSPLGRRPALAGLISFGLVVVSAWGLTHVYSGRAAFMHLGAMMGTIMAANVWRVIIPAQAKMVAATRAGQPADAALGEGAKLRSIHNHYLSLPVLFTMLSNHFPSTYGAPLNWLVLVLLIITGAALKYAMNVGSRGNRLILLAGLASLLAVVTLTARAARPAVAGGDYQAAPPVSFRTAREIIERRCVTCHAAKPSNPSFPQPPGSVTLEDPRHIRDLAARIMVRAVVTKTMPLGNLTGMTDEERATLGAWIAQGARTADPPAAPAGPR
jgi:uncharacterized membrane protein